MSTISPILRVLGFNLEVCQHPPKNVPDTLVKIVTARLARHI